MTLRVRLPFFPFISALKGTNITCKFRIGFHSMFLIGVWPIHWELTVVMLKISTNQLVMVSSCYTVMKDSSFHKAGENIFARLDITLSGEVTSVYIGQPQSRLSNTAAYLSMETIRNFGFILHQICSCSQD